MVVYPLEDGRCPRCGVAQPSNRIYCFACSLRLAPGNDELSSRADQESAEWMSANPERAAAWQEHVVASTAGEHRHGDTRTGEVLADLVAAAVEARVLAQVASQAMDKLRRAHDRCLGMNIPDVVIAKHLAADHLPGVPPLPVPTTRTGGGFAFFYAESGIDADADGDVDGGLIDVLTGSDDNGTSSDDGGFSDALGDLFG